MLVLDVETHIIKGIDGVKVRTLYDVPDLVCVAFSWDNQKGHLYTWNDPRLPGIMEELLESNRIIGGHNLAFDAAVLARAFGHEKLWRDKCYRFEVLDTLVLDFLVRPDYNGPRHLKTLAKRWCGVELDKGAVRTSFRQETPLTPAQKQYAEQDAVVTFRVLEELLRLGPGAGSHEPALYEQHDVICQAPPYSVDFMQKLYSAVAVLRGMGVESRGMPVNLGRVAEYAVAAERECEELLETLVEAGLARYERDKTVAACPWEGGGTAPRKWTYYPAPRCFLRSTKAGIESQAAKITLTQQAIREAYAQVRDEYHLDDVPETDAGEISTEYDYWKEHRHLLPESLQAHLGLSKVRKMLSSYYRPLLASGGERVYPSYGIGWTTQTGRWSAWRPSIQNQPRNRRDMYRAQAGHLFVGADYKSLELYTLAQAMHRLGIEGRMLELLQKDEDIHRLTAALLFEVEVGEVTKDQRQAAKSCNFGIPGGLGPKKFARLARSAYGLDWDLDTARQMRRRWLDLFHDVEEYFSLFKVSSRDLRPWNFRWRDWLEALELDPDDQISMRDIVNACDQGKIYRVGLADGRILPRRTYTQAMNANFQGLGATVITQAYLNCEAARLPVVAVVHDSITCEVPDFDAELAGTKLQAAMRSALHHVCPNVPAPELEVKIDGEWS